MKPLILLPACVRDIGINPFHVVGDKYVRAVSEASGGYPLLLPSLGDALDRRETLARADGLLFTGSPSNVEPHHYDGEPSAPGTDHDQARDATTLPLIREAIATGVPILCICRGIQELNAALGGTLHQLVHDVPGRLDHREDKTAPREEQYGPAHSIEISEGGVLAGLWPERHVEVNSLHSQGIDRLAPSLAMEAVAPDGQVEAVRVKDAASFALGIQWHPEWRVTENPFSMAIFEAFGQATRERAASR
jgi:putative glutamine amidotransferase